MSCWKSTAWAAREEVYTWEWQTTHQHARHGFICDTRVLKLFVEVLVVLSCSRFTVRMHVLGRRPSHLSRVKTALMARGSACMLTIHCCKLQATWRQERLYNESPPPSDAWPLLPKNHILNDLDTSHNISRYHKPHRHVHSRGARAQHGFFILSSGGDLRSSWKSSALVLVHQCVNDCIQVDALALVQHGRQHTLDLATLESHRADLTDNLLC